MLKVFSEEEIDIFEMRRQGIFYLHKCSDIVPSILEEEYAQLYEVIQQSKYEWIFKVECHLILRASRKNSQMIV